MKPFFENILLFSIFISISNAEIKYIDEQFDLCEYDTQRPINYEIVTNNQLNELNLFSKLEDEYNYFSFGKPRPIYSSYGIIYECN
jgi:spore cortex formation protein SpoVR/YcgB (stage V sporulation)